MRPRLFGGDILENPSIFPAISSSLQSESALSITHCRPFRNAYFDFFPPIFFLILQLELEEFLLVYPLYPTCPPWCTAKSSRQPVVPNQEIYPTILSDIILSDPSDIMVHNWRPMGVLYLLICWKLLTQRWRRWSGVYLLHRFTRLELMGGGGWGPIAFIITVHSGLKTAFGNT